MKLYELTSAYQQLSDVIAANDGELTPELELSLDQLADELPGKVDGICCLIRQFETDAAAAKEESQRLGSLASSRARSANNLKNYLKTNLGKLGQPKIKTPRFNVWVQKNGRPSIEWLKSIDDLPIEYVQITAELNGQAAYEFWKGGIPLPEGFRVEQGTHLRII